MHLIRICAQISTEPSLQRKHEPAHDNSGCTANRLYNTARPPNRMMNLVGSNDVFHRRTQASKVSREEHESSRQASKQGDR